LRIVNYFSLLRGPVFGLGLAALAMLAPMPESRAQSLEPALPPVSAPRAKFFENNPEAWNQFLSGLPRLPSVEPLATAPRALPPAGGSWSAVTTAPAGVCNPLLLTDGTVMAHSCNAPQWYRLIPDINGNYADGTWLQLASLPVIGGTQYEPLYHASAVLPDGRVIIMGGEYNGSNTEAFTDLGAIYDPLANAWTAVTAPASLDPVGDAQSVVLADGTFMLGGCCAFPDADALLNAATLGWTTTGAPNADGKPQSYQDEQGYELLPNGNVLTLDIWTDHYSTNPNRNPKNAEQYTPSSGTWTSAGTTPVSLVDPYQCANFEIGPAALRPDGSLVAFGGNSGCVAPKTDPTAIYDSAGGAWSAGPNVPALCGSAGNQDCTLADAPAAVLPNGNILFAASAKYAVAPTHFFEFTSATSTAPNTINQVADTLFNANTSASYYYNYLVLPNGQIFATDLSTTPEIYTPTGSANASWAPTISTAPPAVVAGATYPISGTQFNGLSQGAYYGDDVQAATNYPIVQITNSATGHVFYGRSFDHSTMSIAPGTAGSTNFTVPANVETGPSNVVVIANGIASAPVGVAVEHSAYAKPPDFDGDGDSDILWRNANGQVSIWFMNGATHSSTSQLGAVTQAQSIVGTGKFNSDGDTDILWRNINGQVSLWLMTGATHTTVNLGTVPTTQTVIGTGDFNGDGTTDILWRTAAGQVSIWLMSGGAHTSTMNLGTISTAQTIVGTGDFDGDGTTDILWRNANGQVSVWLMKAGAHSSTVNLGVISAAQTIVGTGDFDGDGTTDILWRNTNGQVQIWLMKAGAHKSTVNLGVVPIEKQIAATSDFEGNGTSDILWRDSDGQVSIWFMKAGAHTTTANLGVVAMTQTIIQ
jgi:hypothetical protein